MQKSLLNQDLFREFTVTDYAFVKTLLFARKNLPEDEFRLFQKMFTVLNQSFPKPDLLVYFHRNVDILLENISNRGREYEKILQENILPKYKTPTLNISEIYSPILY